MPGLTYFMDTNLNVEGDLIGNLILRPDKTLLKVIPLTGTTLGQWFEVKKYDKICIGLWCDTSGTFLVCGSQLVALPPDYSPQLPASYDGGPAPISSIAYGQTGALNSVASINATGEVVFTAAGEAILVIKTPLRWIKVKSVANGGLALASLIGV
jgi:hypothetical protein